MKKYAAYVSGRATRIRNAITKYNELKNAIACVISDEPYDEELAKFFRENKIEYYSLDFKSLDKNQDRNLLFSDFLCERLKNHNIDYCFSFGGHILKGRLLEEYKYRLVNFHPGIIPDIIGLHAIDKALAEKKRFIGNTVHFIDEGVDSGPIIMQNVMLSENFKSYGYDVFLDEQITLLWKTFNLIENDKIEITNNKVIIKDADYSISYIYPKME